MLALDFDLLTPDFAIMPARVAQAHHHVSFNAQLNEDNYHPTNSAESANCSARTSALAQEQDSAHAMRFVASAQSSWVHHNGQPVSFTVRKAW